MPRARVPGGSLSTARIAARKERMIGGLRAAAAALVCVLPACRNEPAFSAGGPSVPGFSLWASDVVTSEGQVGRGWVEIIAPDSGASYYFAIARAPVHGMAEIDGNGQIRFVPGPGFSGLDTFRVSVTAAEAATAASTIIVRALVGRPERRGGARVYSSPYAGVNWRTDHRLKVQLHDHPGASVNRLRAYDLAGYDVVSAMDYSGVRALPYALRSVPWPVENWLPSSFLGSLVNIKFFIPSAEQVGYAHMVSPFLGTYIERWQDSLTPPGPRAAWQYGSSQQAIALINRFGGMAFLAHPWYSRNSGAQLDNYAGMEIYSAFARYRAEEGVDPYFTRTDRNAMMLASWDNRLLKDQRALGIAVNDHFGPDNTSTRLNPRTRDSGKIVVLAPAVTPAALRSALASGAMFAVEDIGLTKDRFPRIDSIVYGSASLSIVTTDEVTWTANGRQIETGPVIDFRALPSDAVYVRATVVNTEGSRVYTQAFPVRLVGDADGDRDVDALDGVVCGAVARAADRNPDHVAACKAVQTLPGGITLW